MKGIYLTEEGKQEIEAKIAELERVYPEFLKNQLAGTLANRALVSAYKEILSSAIILSVEESWSDMQILNNDNLEYVKSKFANGVIIQPKQ
jgi:endonuclease/exonuclease/phosphatase (EEP) superfamily protein YafD